MNIDVVEALKYLLDYIECCVSNDTYNVLTDSDEDPHYSAVTTANVIKCYIKIKREIGDPTLYHTVDEYLYDNCFTTKDVQVFNEKKEKESAYYRGKQY